MDELKRLIKKPGNGEVFAGILGALVTTVDERAQPELVKILDDYLASTNNLIVPMTVIDGLGQEGGPEAYRGVTVLARAKPFDTRNSAIAAAVLCRRWFRFASPKPLVI